MLTPRAEIQILTSFIANLSQIVEPELERRTLSKYLDYVHILVFFAFSIAMMCFRNRLNVSVLDVCLLCIAFAIASESFQLHVTSRSAQISDVMLDLIGAIEGIFIYLFISRIWRLRESL